MSVAQLPNVLDDVPAPDPSWRMPFVEPFTPIIVYQNTREEHPRAGLVMRVVSGRLVDAVIASGGELIPIRESRHVSDPELQRRDIRDMISRTPLMTVFDIAPHEIQRRNLIVSMEAARLRLQEIERVLEKFTVKLDAMTKQVVALVDASPNDLADKRRPRPTNPS